MPHKKLKTLLSLLSSTPGGDMIETNAYSTWHGIVPIGLPIFSRRGMRWNSLLPCIVRPSLLGSGKLAMVTDVSQVGCQKYQELRSSCKSDLLDLKSDFVSCSYLGLSLRNYCILTLIVSKSFNYFLAHQAGPPRPLARTVASRKSPRCAGVRSISPAWRGNSPDP